MTNQNSVVMYCDHLTKKGLFSSKAKDKNIYAHNLCVYVLYVRYICLSLKRKSKTTVGELTLPYHKKVFYTELSCKAKKGHGKIIQKRCIKYMVGLAWAQKSKPLWHVLP